MKTSKTNHGNGKWKQNKSNTQGNEEAGSAHLHKTEIPEGENKEGNL